MSKIGEGEGWKLTKTIISHDEIKNKIKSRSLGETDNEDASDEEDEANGEDESPEGGYTVCYGFHWRYGQKVLLVGAPTTNPLSEAEGCIADKFPRSGDHPEGVNILLMNDDEDSTVEWNIYSDGLVEIRNNITGSSVFITNEKYYIPVEMARVVIDNLIDA